jgi:hypothetical protein
MDYGFEYMKDHGISFETDYPYVGTDQSCKKQLNRFKLTGYVDVPQQDNDQLLVALNIEPVSVAVEAD